MYYIRLFEGSNEITSLGVQGFNLPNWYFIAINSETASSISDYNLITVSATALELTPPGLVTIDVHGEITGQGTLILFNAVLPIAPAPIPISTKIGSPAFLAAEIIQLSSFDNTSLIGSPSLTSNYQAIAPYSFNNSVHSEIGFPNFIGEPQTIVVSGFASNTEIGMPYIYEPSKLSIPWIPRWADPAYPVGSNAAKLIHALVVRPKSYLYQGLEDALVSINSRTDTNLEYWRVSWDEDSPQSVSLDDEIIPFVNTIGDGLSNPQPSWTKSSKTVIVFWGNLHYEFLYVNTFDDITAILPANYTGRIFVYDTNRKFSCFDASAINDIPEGYYTVGYYSDNKELKIDGKLVTNFAITDYSNRWDELSALWSIRRSEDEFTRRGRAQAASLLLSTKSKISASLYDLSAQWWTGQTTLATAASSEFDTPLTTIELITERPTKQSDTVFYLSRKPTRILIEHNGEVLEPNRYTVVNHIITFNFTPDPGYLLVRYTHESRITDIPTLTLGSDLLPDRYYPVFKIRSINLENTEIKRKIFKWNSPNLDNGVVSTFL